MAHYPSLTGFNQPPSYTSTPQMSNYPPGTSLTPGGQTSYPQQNHLGGQTSFTNQGPMGYPPQGTGNVVPYPSGGLSSPPAYGTPSSNSVFLVPPSYSQGNVGPNTYMPCTAPPNNYPQMANHGNANSYAPTGYPPY